MVGLGVIDNVVKFKKCPCRSLRGDFENATLL